MPKAETPRKAAKKPVEAQTPVALGVDAPAPAKAARSLQAKKTGRPSKYTSEIAQEMCNLLSDGIPLREICRKEGFPAWQTVYDWMCRDDEAVAAGHGVGLSRAIARAREVGYDALAEECLTIANTPHIGVKEVTSVDHKGNETVALSREDMLGHRKLQIETRLKLLAKWDPKRFGEKVQLSGDAENPIKVQAETQAEAMMEALLKNIELKRQSVTR
jgi:hypothetical protein